MGTPGFAVGVLARLLEGGVNVVRVVTVPDRPAGRGLRARSSAVKEFAQAHALPILQPERLDDPSFLALLREDAIDIGVVVAFRKLPQGVVNIPSRGFFNLHASLLPQLRGAAPINWALIHGFPETGVTTFLLNDAIDCGEILLQSSVKLTSATTAGELHDSLMEIGSELAVNTVRGLWDGTIQSVAQPDREDLIPAPKIFRGDCLLNFHRSAEMLHNLCRGVSPMPGAWCYMKVKDQEVRTVKLFNTEAIPKQESAHPQSAPGVAIPTDGGKALDILCGDGCMLRVREIQPAGKRRMSVYDFLLGAGDSSLYFTAESQH